ncbi:MAG: hypothetical protein CSA65_01870 [Proteobacteria bacterium]|nr:MAG: hypothetical protein CSA65_01870 [Pseudomonadota bacterium]
MPIGSPLLFRPKGLGNEELIIWDLVEEHLDEAGFYLTQRRLALRSVGQTLADVEANAEAKVRFHLRALEIAGEAAFTRLLRPLLEAPADTEAEPFQVACIFALLTQRHALLAPSLQHERSCRLLARCCSTFGDAETDQWIISLFGSNSCSLAAKLELAASRRIKVRDLGVDLLCDDEWELLASLRALRWSSNPPPEMAFVNPSVAVRDTALLATATSGRHESLRQAKLLMAKERTQSGLALWVVALLGSPDDQSLVLEAVASETLQPAAIWAAGFSGCKDLVPPLLDVVAREDACLARLAGEAIARLTGIPLWDESLHLQPRRARSQPTRRVAKMTRKIRRSTTLTTSTTSTTLTPIVGRVTSPSCPSSLMRPWLPTSTIMRRP